MAHRKVKCKRGHRFNVANTYIDARGTQQCRTCRAAHQQKYRAMKRSRSCVKAYVAQENAINLLGQIRMRDKILAMLRTNPEVTASCDCRICERSDGSAFADWLEATL